MTDMQPVDQKRYELLKSYQNGFNCRTSKRITVAFRTQRKSSTLISIPLLNSFASEAFIVIGNIKTFFEEKKLFFYEIYMYK